MKKYQGFIFDLDGTLLDSAPLLLDSLGKLAKTKNIKNIDYQKAKAQISYGARALIEFVFKNEINTKKEKLAQELISLYKKNAKNDSILFKNTEQLLLFLEQKKIPWGVITNKNKELTKLALTKFDVFKKANFIISADTFSEKKPHPTVAQKAQDLINIKAQDILYLGDSLVDFEFAKNANFDFGFATYGYIAKEDSNKITGENPEFIFEKEEDLKNKIISLCS